MTDAPRGTTNVGRILRRLGSDMPVEDRDHYERVNARLAEIQDVLGNHRSRLDALTARVGTQEEASPR